MNPTSNFLIISSGDVIEGMSLVIQSLHRSPCTLLSLLSIRDMSIQYTLRDRFMYGIN